MTKEELPTQKGGFDFGVFLLLLQWNLSLSIAKLDRAPRRGGGDSMHLGDLHPRPWCEAVSAHELEPMPPSQRFKHVIWGCSRAKPLGKP